MRINLINKYSKVDSVKPDNYEKAGNLLSYPVHVLFGGSYHQTNMTKKPKYTTGHKLLALWALFTTTPITVTATLIGLTLKHYSSSHKAHRQAHDAFRKTQGKLILDPKEINLKNAKQLAKAAKNKLKASDAITKQLREATRKAAARPENLPTAGPQHYHPELINLLKVTSSNLIPIIIEETAQNTSYTPGFEAAISHLISEAYKNNNFELIQSVLKSEIVLNALKNVLDFQEQAVKDNKFSIDEDNHSLKLNIAFEILDSLLLPQDIADQISRIVEAMKVEIAPTS